MALSLDKTEALWSGHEVDRGAKKDANLVTVTQTLGPDPPIRV